MRARIAAALFYLLAVSIASAFPGSALAHPNKTKAKPPSKSSAPSKRQERTAKPKPRKAKRKIRKKDISPLPAAWLRHIQKKQYQKLLDSISRQKSDLGGRRPFLEGYALFKLERHREAIGKWKKATIRTPALRTHILHFTAKAAEALKDDESARRSLEKLIRHKPTGPRADQAHETLARIALREDRPLEAARWFGRLLQRFPNHEKAASFLAERARALEAGGRNRDAALAWRRLWSKYPQNADADRALDRARDLAFGIKPPLRPIGARDYFLRARKLQKNNFYQKPYRGYRELKRLFPNSAYRRDIALQEALTLYALRKTDKAQSALEEAIHLFPSDSSVRAKARFYLSRNHLRRHDPSAFRMEVRTLLDESPKNHWAARARYLMARVYEDELEYESAERFYREVVKIHPYSHLAPTARWQLSWIQLQRKSNLDAFKGFRRLARRFPSHRLAPSALYWSGVAAERAGELELAAAQYRRGVQHFRHLYYGQLSAKALRRLAKRRNSLAAKPLATRTAGYKKWLRPPAGPLLPSAKTKWRAAELLSSMGFYDLSGEEYARLGSSPYFLYQAALSYSRDGQHGKAIRIFLLNFLDATQSGGKDLPPEFWKISFPLMVKQKVPRGADPLLVNSIIKAESLFDRNALSRAGAIGLMQLMPATGRRVAKKLKIRVRSNAQLFEPEINLRLGAYHLGDLVRDFKGEVVPAIASYNAGRRVVKRWWQKRKNESIETFIERIPYQETRNYVKKVLGYLQEYRRVYPNHHRSAKRPKP
ncbi:MAG: transglycosylase SLT domain-containing protein [bacterium]